MHADWTKPGYDDASGSAERVGYAGEVPCLKSTSQMVSKANTGSTKSPSEDKYTRFRTKHRGWIRMKIKKKCRRYKSDCVF